MLRSISLLGVMCLLMGMAVIGCSDSKTFKINGEISDKATTNLYVKYYGDNAVQTGVTAAREGKFEAEFSTQDRTIVEILDNEYRVLARLFLKNGDEVNLMIDRKNPNNNKVTGEETNRQWSELLNANADLLASGDSEKVNAFLDDYISSNPDNVLSTLMFASFYDWSKDPVHADSIASLIASEVRLASVLDWYVTQIRRFANPLAYGRLDKINFRGVDSDSSLTFVPGNGKVSLLVLSNENSRRGDSIVPYLKDISKAYPKAKLQILDLSLYADTISWKFSSRRDSATWQQGWLPGGLLGEGVNQLAVPGIPYYIVADTAGNQRYRGRSIIEAQEAIGGLISSPKEATLKTKK